MNFRYSWIIAALIAAFWSDITYSQEAVVPAIQEIEDEWAEVFYKLPLRQQIAPFNALLERVRSVKTNFPEQAEPLVMEAVVLCTLAAADWGFSSLGRLQDARELLIKAIDVNPRAMEGTAFITLGNLYYRLPGWPISYGDDQLAVQYLEAAEKLYPDNLDVNFFLGDYWLREGQYDKALVYLKKADEAPVRPNQQLSDEKLKEELKTALDAAQKQAASHTDFFSSLLPDLGDERAETTP